MEKKRQVIMMVDDNPTILVTGKSSLKKHFEVYTIPTVEKLFGIMEKVMPDLILLDVEMPDVDGYAALKKLKADEKTCDIPVIFLSAKTDQESELEGLELGAIDYIFKPFSAALLQKRIENILLTVSQTQKLKQINEQLTLANNTKSRFLAQMSHEIRTPMNAIIGMADLIRTDNLDNVQLSYFHDMRQMARALLEIINDIIDFSKIDSGEMDIEAVDFNLPELFDHICSVNRFLAVNKDLEFRAQYDERLPDVIYCDETRLRQIVSNLVSNAIKYTHEGHVQLSFMKEQRGDKTYLAAVVEDTGVGMDEKSCEKITALLQQPDIQLNTSMSETGLGLTISKFLLDMMGGFIEAKSVHGKGTTITAFFPLVSGDASKVEYTIIVDAVVARENIPALVVDDNSVNLTVAQGYLATHNIIADTAKSGHEAIDMVQKKNYDIVFMDHMMPVMDGVEATRLIRELPDPRFKKLPIVALTANVISGAKEALLQAGMDDFISKPIEAHELNTVLVKWLPKEKIEIRHEKSPQQRLSHDSHHADKPLAEMQQARIWQASIQRAGTGQSVEDAPSTKPAVNQDKALAAEGASEEDVIISELQNLNGLNTKTGLMYLAGKKVPYIRALKIFCDEFAGYRKILETTCAGNNWSDYRIQAHALKSACAMLGIKELSELAASLERASKEQDADICVRDTPPFCEQAQKFRDALAAKLG
jgi:signal transduction histidine kinase/HPt (histidine-containing phosphotransfer) domain-containing protein